MGYKVWEFTRLVICLSNKYSITKKYLFVMTHRDFQHSRPLYVHRWSEHSEANLFVDIIYSQYLEQAKENKRIKKSISKLYY